MSVRENRLSDFGVQLGLAAQWHWQWFCS